MNKLESLQLQIKSLQEIIDTSSAMLLIVQDELATIKTSDIQAHSWDIERLIKDEKYRVMFAIDRYPTSRKRAAQLLNMSERTLYRKLKDLNIIVSYTD